MRTALQQISMPPEGFEPAIPVGERPQTDALDRSGTGIGDSQLIPYACNDVNTHDISPFLHSIVVTNAWREVLYLYTY